MGVALDTDMFLKNLMTVLWAEVGESWGENFLVDETHHLSSFYYHGI